MMSSENRAHFRHHALAIAGRSCPASSAPPEDEIKLRNKLVVLVIVVASCFAYTKLMARVGSGSPPPDAPLEQRADLIRVYKSERRMVLSEAMLPSLHTGFL
jgi:hypothetical protein